MWELPGSFDKKAKLAVLHLRPVNKKLSLIVSSVLLFSTLLSLSLFTNIQSSKEVDPLHISRYVCHLYHRRTGHTLLLQFIYDYDT